MYLTCLIAPGVDSVSWEEGLERRVTVVVM